ncbi:uncharacterized protein NEMAJ01_1615 [Nematocida major]|uniref:uncharacterized protein n=1 Tax=Nematocida major TaxID=1912982 RepID=UPI002007E0C5|nr:uncharacterized protein NEMAJ01_1615 [Nematocida major]KAH9386719.1 hypothetical protein NEMAJ01_1615 [Nematocida major]
MGIYCAISRVKMKFEGNNQNISTQAAEEVMPAPGFAGNRYKFAKGKNPDPTAGTAKTDAYMWGRAVISTTGELLENCGFLIIYHIFVCGTMYSFLIGVFIQITSQIGTMGTVFMQEDASPGGERHAEDRAGGKPTEEKKSSEPVFETYREIVTAPVNKVSEAYAVVTMLQSTFLASAFAVLIATKILSFVGMVVGRSSFPVWWSKDSSYASNLLLVIIILLILMEKKKLVLRKTRDFVYIGFFAAFVLVNAALLAYLLSIDPGWLLLQKEPRVHPGIIYSPYRETLCGRGISAICTPMLHNTCSFVMREKRLQQEKRKRGVRFGVSVILSAVYFMVAVVGFIVYDKSLFGIVCGDFFFGATEMLQKKAEAPHLARHRRGLMRFLLAMRALELASIVVLANSAVKHIGVLCARMFPWIEKILAHIDDEYAAAHYGRKDIETSICAIKYGVATAVLFSTADFIVRKNIPMALSLCGLTLTLGICAVFPVAVQVMKAKAVRRKVQLLPAKSSYVLASACGLILVFSAVIIPWLASARQ